MLITGNRWGAEFQYQKFSPDALRHLVKTKLAGMEINLLGFLPALLPSDRNSSAGLKFVIIRTHSPSGWPDVQDYRYLYCPTLP
jgi:hypothetical protein